MEGWGSRNKERGMQNSDIFTVLERVATEAISRTPSLTINRNPAIISYGSDEKEFALYLSFSKQLSDGSNLLSGWTSFAFVANRPLSKATVGERIMGRRLVNDSQRTFKQMQSTLPSGYKVGTYSGILESDQSDLPLVMSTDLFRGTWAIIPDKSKQKIQRVWLIKKK